MSATDLKQQCRQTSHEIQQFLDDRKKSAPSVVPASSPWHGSNLEKARYAAETVELYQVRFSARVTALSEALQGRGCSDSEFEAVLRQPLSQAVMKTVAEKLRVVAEQLP
jgi:hypothetical protein